MREDERHQRMNIIKKRRSTLEEMGAVGSIRNRALYRG